MCDFVYLGYVGDFNSHAHVERDSNILNGIELFPISTHTLTWSVTIISITPFTPSTISTHTLTWSVTQFYNLYVGEVTISTHTLTWSVTTVPLPSLYS